MVAVAIVELRPRHAQPKPTRRLDSWATRWVERPTRGKPTVAPEATAAAIVVVVAPVAIVGALESNRIQLAPVIGLAGRWTYDIITPISLFLHSDRIALWVLYI